MAKAIATVRMGVDMEDIARRIMHLRGMHRSAMWSANASRAVRDTIMGIGDMDVGTVMDMAITSMAATVTDMAIATNENHSL